MALVFAVAALGYWYGSYRASEAYTKRYLSDAFNREILDARNEFRMLQALDQCEYRSALEVARVSYYSRLLVIQAIPEQYRDASSSRLFREHLAEASGLLKKDQSYRFSSADDQKNWEALLKTLP